MHEFWSFLALLGKPMNRLFARLHRLVTSFGGEITPTLGPATVGQPVEGTVTIRAKRPLGPGRFTATLTCTDERCMWETRYEHRVRNWYYDEIYRHEVDLDLTLGLAPGEERTFTVWFPTPDPASRRATDGVLSYHLEPKQVDQSAVWQRNQKWELTFRFERRGPNMVEKVALPLEYELDRSLV